MSPPAKPGAYSLLSQIHDAGIVDENVETTVFVQHRGGRGGYTRLIEEVDLHKRGDKSLRGQVRDCGIATFGISGADDDDGDAGLRELARNLPSDALVYAGDECDAVCGCHMDSMSWLAALDPLYEGFFNYGIRLWLRLIKLA